MDPAMKTSSRIAAVALATVLICSSANAAGGSWSGGGRSYGGSHWGYRGYGGRGWGFSWGYGWPWYGYYGYPYYYAPYYPYGYYYDAPMSYPPSVVYGTSPPAAAESPAMSVPDDNKRPAEADRPLPPSAIYKDPWGYPPGTPSPAPPQSMPYGQPKSSAPPAPPVQPMSVADVKALVKAGIGDEVVVSHIQQSRVVFRLTTQEIIDLKKNGVSNKVIDFMINTPGRQGQ